MTYPDPIGIPPHPRTAGEPLHDHEFKEQVDTHLQRLAAERTPSVALVEERTEKDVQSEVLRSALYDLTTLHNIVAAHVRESAGRATAFEALDRIESAVRRGEQR